MYRRSLVLLLCLVCLFLSVGCAGSPSSAREVLAALQKEQAPLPAGACYHLLTPSDQAEHLSDALLASLFGETEPPVAMSEVEDAAFFFAYNGSCELLLFRCKSVRGRDRVAQMCLARLSYLQGVHPDQASEALQNGSVTVRGRWVLLCISPQHEATLAVFRRAT
ncbi:MAG: hypothetical protein IKC31_03280 [Clostridia bacterium]|nr:hypothetical protein [Clostridia bacterium]